MYVTNYLGSISFDRHTYAEMESEKEVEVTLNLNKMYSTNITVEITYESKSANGHGEVYLCAMN